MAAPSQAARGRITAALALGALLLGCSSAGRQSKTAREPLPPQMVVPPSASDDAAVAQPIDERAGMASEQPASPTAADSTLIVIDPAESAPDAPLSLAEAAARERARRDGESRATLVITNQNLSQHAAGGVLTIAHAAAGEQPGASDAEALVAQAAVEEELWRERGLEIRKRWRDAADLVPTLEAKVAELRVRFYSTDDPAVRDGQVKPQWDRALADLEQARYQAARGAEEVASFLEEGRRAGALPGWLREGSELEPAPVVTDIAGPADHEAREPSIYEPPPGR